MDPNLLPNELRSKEDKEQVRLKKHPADFDIELSLPPKDKQQDNFQSGKIVTGFWASIFGGKAQSPVPENLTVPAADYSRAKAVDLLSPGRVDVKAAKQHLVTPRAASGHFKPVKSHRKYQRKNWLSYLFGRPVSPIVEGAIVPAKTDEQPVYQQKKFVQPQDKPVVRTAVGPTIGLPTKISSSQAVKQKKIAGDSWSEIIKGLFGYGRKKRIDFRLASFAPEAGKLPVPTTSHTPPVRSILPGDSHKPYHAATSHHDRVEQKNKTEKARGGEAKSSYHLAPKRERADEFNVNLMPQELAHGSSNAKANPAIAAIMAAVIPALVIAVAYIGIYLLQNNLKSDMAAKQLEFNGLQKQLGDFLVQEKQNNQTADRVAAIRKLLEEKIIWNNFFDQLEKYTLDGVYFNSLAADTSGVLSLPGVADDYGVLAQQIAALRDAKGFIKEVKLTNAQLLSEGRAGVIGVSFQLKLILADGVFKKPIANQ